ncbi:hypothetical protein CVT25_015766 [Psilocybe cyanescens]|uniref:Uncharacterized protein n=1 Tax=Psilocybe cyanescens TaxID=93625 RepID=A0A409WRV9_PSICY|nr:hypothetical protein CVT25_015766 [Psilocybe cyanescens]
MASCPADYDWAVNAQGMDPCEVATRLKATQHCLLFPQANPIVLQQPRTKRSAPALLQSTISFPLVPIARAGHSVVGVIGLLDAIIQLSINGVTIPNWAYFDVGTIRSFDPVFAKVNSPSPPVRQTTVKPTTTTKRPPQNTPKSDPLSISTPTPVTSVTNPGSNSSGDISSSDTSTDTDTATGIGTDTGTTQTNTDTSTGSGKTSDASTTAIPGLNGSASQAISSPAAYQSGLNAAYSSDTLTGPGHSRIDPSQPTDSSGNPIDSVSGSKKSNAGAIAGGAIGGLLLLAIICGFAYWWIIRRRRRSHMAPSAAYIAAYGSTRPDTSMSSRPLADRSNSVLDLMHGRADSYSPYRYTLLWLILKDEDQLRGSTATINATSQVQYSQARASSLDHYQRPT